MLWQFLIEESRGGWSIHSQSQSMHDNWLPSIIRLAYAGEPIPGHSFLIAVSLVLRAHAMGGRDLQTGLARRNCWVAENSIDDASCKDAGLRSLQGPETSRSHWSGRGPISGWRQMAA